MSDSHPGMRRASAALDRLLAVAHMLADLGIEVARTVLRSLRSARAAAVAHMDRGTAVALTGPAGTVRFGNKTLWRLAVCDMHVGD